MKLRKIMFAKEPEVDDDFEDFLNHLSGGGGDDTTDNTDDSDDSDVVDDSGESEFLDSDDNQSTDEETEDTTTTDVDDDIDQPDPRDAIIAKQEEQISKLMEMMGNVTTPKQEEKKADPEPDVFESDAFSKLADVLELKDGEAQLLANFMKQWGSSVSKTAVKDAMDQVPARIDTQITQAQQSRDLKKNFYKENPALEPVQGYVAAIANTVAKENPSFTVNQVLEESAKRSYDSLGIDKESIGKKEKPGKGKKPAFANTPKARKPAPKQSKLDKELSAMLNL